MTFTANCWGGLQTQSMLSTPAGVRTRSSSDHTYRMICYSAGTGTSLVETYIPACDTGWKWPLTGLL